MINSWPLYEFFPDPDAIDRDMTGQQATGVLLRFRQDVIELRPENVLIEVNSYNFRQHARTHEICDYVVSISEQALINNIAPILTRVITPDKVMLNISKNQDNLSDYMILDSL